MAGPTEPEDQLTAERRPAATSATRPRGRATLVLCALLVIAASAATVRWLGVVPAVAVYVAGTLTLVAALFGMARRSDRP